MSISPRGQVVALAGFEPARAHAKRPIGKRASHAQPPGHATVHPQPWSQPTPSLRGSRSWVPLSRFRFHVFPVSCLLLYRAVEVAGVEPAYLCLQGSDPSRRRPRDSQCPPPESNRLLPGFNRTRRPLTQEGRSARRGNRTHLVPLDRRIASPEASASNDREWGDGRESNPHLAVHSRALLPLSYQNHQWSGWQDLNLRPLAPETSALRD
jgi:hypothetical protein